MIWSLAHSSFICVCDSWAVKLETENVAGTVTSQQKLLAASLATALYRVTEFLEKRYLILFQQGKLPLCFTLVCKLLFRTYSTILYLPWLFCGNLFYAACFPFRQPGLLCCLTQFVFFFLIYLFNCFQFCFSNRQNIFVCHYCSLRPFTEVCQSCMQSYIIVWNSTGMCRCKMLITS